MELCGPSIQALNELERLTTEMSEHEIAQVGVDIAQAVTSSQIAYLHFLNEDQRTIELGVWSHDTLAGCNAIYSRHYPVSAAGIWADSVRTQATCMHNDYENQAGKRGLPAGHSRLVRHLGLPVIEAGRVQLLIGVGNKTTDYDQEDVALLDMVARRIWSVTRQRRLLERYLDLGQRFHHVEEIASVCGLEYDIDEDHLAFDGMFAALFGTRHATETPSNLHEFLAFVAPADHARARAAFSGAAMAQQVLHLECHRRSGQHFPAGLEIQFRRREVGRGVIGVGILQDLSEKARFEDLRRRADTDPLTNLPNRNRLLALFSPDPERRGARAGFAFHYIDLDDFKPVNDSYGHPVGDEVLRIVAQRLQRAVRKDDLVVRMGGDEFAVVQTDTESAAAAAALAAKMIAVIAEPIVIHGKEIRVGASVGIALSAGRNGSLKALSAAADVALYQAKAAGGRGYVISAASYHPAGGQPPG